MRKALLIVATLLAAAALSACGAVTGLVAADDGPPPEEVVPEGGNPLPTPRPGVLVGDNPESQASSDPNVTYERYIFDTIAAQISLQDVQRAMRQRYQDPGITEQDLGGLLTDIAVLEDRTEVEQTRDDVAYANVDMDIRISWADGDTETRTCNYQVNMHAVETEDNIVAWYVINPEPFPVFFSCYKN